MDGGTAFPLHPGILPEWDRSTGLSKRDYIAIAAMQSFIGRALTDDEWRRVPVLSYEMADAMLVARIAQAEGRAPKEDAT